MTACLRSSLFPPSPQLTTKRHLSNPAFRLRALSSPVESRSVISELLEVVQETDRGMNVDSNQRRKIEESVRRLQEMQVGVETTGMEMSASWKMLWTTEKETLFILKNAKFFNKKPGEVYQIIDKEKGTLQNCILFEPDSVFGVDATIQVASPQRVDFQFRRAFYREANKPPFNLPPFGKGWFENVYMDDEIRIARDSRKDILITKRDGLP